jgi:hypothetical protein
MMVLLGVAVQPAEAQLVTPLKNARLSLTISSGTPEAETEVTLKLAGPPGMTVGKVEAVVTFPADALTFDKVTGALIAAELVKVETKVQEPKDGKRALAVTIQSASERPLPPDALLNIVFTVTKGTKPGVLDLQLQAKAFGADGTELQPVEVYGGRINIQEGELFFGCFFYMH